MSGIKTEAWGDDRITFNTCTGYNQLYEDTLIESKSPLKKTVLKFFEEANYIVKDPLVLLALMKSWLKYIRKTLLTGMTTMLLRPLTVVSLRVSLKQNLKMARKDG